MSLYDQVGGDSAITKVVADFYARIGADELIAPWFAAVDSIRYRAHFAALIVVALGGPENYHGRDLRTTHGPLAITRDAFDALLEHLAAALADAGTDRVVVTAVGKQLRALRAVVVAQPGV
jgi:hemoglobin